MRCSKSPCSKYLRRTMSREWPTEALSSLRFSFSACRPRLRRSALRRQSVALLTVDARALVGWAAEPRQAAAAGAAAIAMDAAASSPMAHPRIVGRVEMDDSGCAGRAGLELELQALAEVELPEAPGVAPHLVGRDLQAHVGVEGVEAGSQAATGDERVIGPLAVGAVGSAVESEEDDRHPRDAVDQQSGLVRLHLHA